MRIKTAYVDLTGPRGRISMNTFFVQGKSPYVNLPKRQFWKTGVMEENVLTTPDIYAKKFDIKPTEAIASAGSCFAQHISRRLADSGYNYLDMEAAPTLLPAARHREFGYSTYSARYGNIYTTRQLKELALEALGDLPPLGYSWRKAGAYFDPLRPSVEPDGLSSHDEVQFHRRHHLARVKSLITNCDVFIFTLGLTETWICNSSGRALPTAPGTLAGQYNPEAYSFHNLTYNEVLSDLNDFIELTKRFGKTKERKFLFTVSPVPLTATAMDEHVLVSTTYSKSVLRAVVGELYQSREDVDYFPSYEIITAPWSRGLFYAANLRSVTTAGVNAAMRVFFLQHKSGGSSEPEVTGPSQAVSGPRKDPEHDDDVACEEALLESFAR